MSSTKQSDFAETPVAEIGSSHKSRPTQLRVEVESWANHHDVYHWLLPFESRSSNPMQILQTLAEYIHNAPATQETFTRADSGIEYANPVITNPILQLWRCTVQSDDSTRSVRYRNPRYMHYEARTRPLTDRAERQAFYERWKDTPGIWGEWFAHHFGINRSSTTDWIRRQGYTGRRKQNKANSRRLARTVWTLRQWTGKTQRDILEPMPINSQTIESWIWKFAHPDNTEWRPPKRPCQFKWFDQYQQHYYTNGKYD